MTRSSSSSPQKKRLGLMHWFLLVLLGLFLFALAFVFWGSMPLEEDRNFVETGPYPEGASTVESLTIVSYNMGYARGPLGDYAGPWTKSFIENGVDKVAAAILAEKPDLVFLQEVDFASARSHELDQAALLKAALGFQSMSCATTWNKRYVPFPYWPPSKHYGKMLSGQCILSRFPLKDAKVHYLEQPASNAWYRNRFYLHRAIDEVTLSLSEEGQEFKLFNIHLEAFDPENRQAQLAVLFDLIKKEGSVDHVIAAGDFNSLPPEALQKHAFVDEPEADFRGDETIAEMRKTGLKDAISDPKSFTFPADAPSRRLDYVWYGDALQLKEVKVMEAGFSDHRGIVARFSLR